MKDQVSHPYLKISCMIIRSTLSLSMEGAVTLVTEGGIFPENSVVIMQTWTL